MNTLPIKTSIGPETVELRADSASLPENLYLFDERNRAFLEYRSKKLYDVGPTIVNGRAVTGVSILFLLVLIAVLSSLYRDTVIGIRTDQLRQDGVTTDGHITRHDKFGGGRSGPSYEISFQYLVAGSPHIAGQIIGKYEWDQLYVGDSVTIRYLSSDPTFAQLWGKDEDDTIASQLPGSIAGSIVCGLAILFIVAAYINWLRLKFRRKHQLIINGTTVIVPIEESRLTEGFAGSKSIHLKYTFVSPRSGRTMTRTFVTGWPRNKPRLEVGTPIALLYQNYKNFQVL